MQSFIYQKELRNQFIFLNYLLCIPAENVFFGEACDADDSLGDEPVDHGLCLAGSAVDLHAHHVQPEEAPQ